MRFRPFVKAPLGLAALLGVTPLARDQTTEYVFDTRDKRVEVRQGELILVRFQWDAEGRLTKKIGRQGHSQLRLRRTADPRGVRPERQPAPDAPSRGATRDVSYGSRCTGLTVCATGHTTGRTGVGARGADLNRSAAGAPGEHRGASDPGGRRGPARTGERPPKYHLRDRHTLCFRGGRARLDQEQLRPLSQQGRALLLLRLLQLRIVEPGPALDRRVCRRWLRSPNSKFRLPNVPRLQERDPLQAAARACHGQSTGGPQVRERLRGVAKDRSLLALRAGHEGRRLGHHAAEMARLGEEAGEMLAVCDDLR